MIDTDNARQARKQFPIVFLAAMAIVLLIAAGLVKFGKSVPATGPPAAKPISFGPAEQAYAAQVHFNDIHLAESSNLLNQRFFYISGTLGNEGDRAIARLAMTVDLFSDEKNTAVALQDTETVIGPADPPLPAHEKREVTITMDQLPDSWNRQMPSIHVSGLIFQ